VYASPRDVCGSRCYYQIREDSMENYMVYTPEAHIAITEVYAENGVVYLKFKKPKTQIYEVMTLDMFLSMVYQTLERKYYDESF
jgi:hypothetical protein